MDAKGPMFDPYHKWLGIPPKDQPPNYYRLLAIDLFESDPEVIDAAANRQMAYVQQRATGEHTAESQKLLNELASARLCLLDKKKKSAYDLQLKINVRQQARRAGGGRQDKPPRISGAVGFKSEESLTARELPPPVREVQPPSAEEISAADTPFMQGLLLKRFISFVFVGSLLLLTALLIFLYVIPGTKKVYHTIAEQKDSEEQAGGAKGGRPGTQPAAGAAAVYNVEIDPPSAVLTVQNNMGTVTGSGRAREIRFDSVPWRIYPLITASCEGYKTFTQRLAPKPGQNEDLSIKLEKEMPAAPLISSSANPPKTTANSSSVNITSNVPPANSNNPPINPPGKINRPIDVRSEHLPSPSPVESPRTERRKVFVFSGESAIVTPVQRSLPSTVEAWIWCQKPTQVADMYVFGSDDAGKQSIGGLGLRIDNDGQLGGSRMHKNKKQRDIWTGESVPFQKWTHLAATFDKDRTCFFVDGHLVYTDNKGSQDEGAAKFVVGYIGIGPKIPAYCFVGRMRTLRITTGIRYVNDFRPPFDFNRNQDKEGFKTSLIYDASNGLNDRIPDVSGNNKKDGTGLNIRIVEEEFPMP